MTSSREVNRNRQINVIELAARIGWINAPVVAAALWPMAVSRRKYAERLLAVMCKRGWLKAHRMPNGQPAAYTITSAARDDYALYEQMGTRLLGTTSIPGRTYAHDQRAAAALLTLAKGEISHCIFDRELRRQNPGLTKYPDGILLAPTNEYGHYHGTWIEVENSRKTGKHLTQMINGMIQLNREPAPRLQFNGGIVFLRKCALLVVPAEWDEAAFSRRASSRLVADEIIRYQVLRELPNLSYVITPPRLIGNYW